MNIAKIIQKYYKMIIHKSAKITDEITKLKEDLMPKKITDAKENHIIEALHQIQEKVVVQLKVEAQEVFYLKKSLRI